MLVEITGLYGNVLRLPTDGREGVSQWHSVSEQGATGMSDEQSVVVTGVSTGIGWGSCKVLLSKGFTVFGSVRRKVDADRLQSEFGDAFIPLIMEVTDKQAVELYLFYSASAFFAGLGFGRPDDHQKCRGCDGHGNEPATNYRSPQNVLTKSGLFFAM
jgi:short chain dehydrogenase